MTVAWKVVEQYFNIVVLIIFKFYPVFNFENLSSFDLALPIKSERVKQH